MKDADQKTTCEEISSSRRNSPATVTSTAVITTSTSKPGQKPDKWTVGRAVATVNYPPRPSPTAAILEYCRRDSGGTSTTTRGTSISSRSSTHPLLVGTSESIEEDKQNAGTTVSPTKTPPVNITTTSTSSPTIATGTTSSSIATTERKDDKHDGQNNNNNQKNNVKNTKRATALGRRHARRITHFVVSDEELDVMLSDHYKDLPLHDNVDDDNGLVGRQHHRHRGVPMTTNVAVEPQKKNKTTVMKTTTTTNNIHDECRNDQEDF